ncbi:HAL/PAL/TAL family ammonia-lyase [Ensifer soli]|uniref:HAL/PAL/TAL family ammonia-lyase n=1 Tax=Ciceribacter sp. sgz301302 TaxID=3342379 RepID=UPI0035B977C6
MDTILLDDGLDWRGIAAIAEGARLTLSAAAWDRIDHARAIVTAIVESGVRAYGVTTGVGALSDTAVDRAAQQRLSRNLIMSHAAGVGPLLPEAEVRSIIAAQISNLAHGHSGVRAAIIRHYLAFLDHGCIPHVPSKGSAGYLTHNAHIALVLIGEGRARLDGRSVSGREALAAMGLEPLLLEAKEGLSLVNGSACATGLGALALARAERLIGWAEAAAALTIEALGGQVNAFGEDVLSIRRSEGLQAAGADLRARLAGSGMIPASQGRRTQDALSLRAVPHAHGAARDAFAFVAEVVDREIASVTDNPALFGTPEDPRVASQAHAVAPALGHGLDTLAIALAQIAIMSERRIERLTNPALSGLPAFLAADPGAGSGFMIAQYTACVLAAENRRLAAPASVDGGVTSALQEDFLGHPTSAANKLMTLIDNTADILSIELLAAAEASDIQAGLGARAPGTEAIHRAVRDRSARYADDRPLSAEIAAVRGLLDALPPAIP